MCVCVCVCVCVCTSTCTSTGAYAQHIGIKYILGMWKYLQEFLNHYQRHMIVATQYFYAQTQAKALLVYCRHPISLDSRICGHMHP